MTCNRMPAALLALAAALPFPAPAQEVPDDAPEAAGQDDAEPRRGGWLRHLLDAVEAVDTPVYRRNALDLKYEWTERPGGAAMGQIMFKPTFAWGQNREFALRIEAPVETVYPGVAGEPTVSGFASLTTTFFWAFFSEKGIRQAVGLELQWNTGTRTAVGQPWILQPVYGIGFHFVDWLAVTVELNWQKSFGNLGGYLPVNTLQVKPTVTAALPAWFFASVQDKTSWSLEDHDVGSLLKFTAGRFLTEKKTVVLAVEYETPLDPVAARDSVMMVGVLLSYYFSW